MSTNHHTHNTNKPPKPGAWALSYATKHGLPVFPLAPNSKVPLISKEQGGNGSDDGTCDPVQITVWWRATPRANVGIATGRANGKQNVVVLDVDVTKGGTLDAAATLCGGTLPETKRVRTGSGGWHLYFLLPDYLDDDAIRNSAGKLGPGIDIRGSGGYVVAPPSRHPNGQFYTWHAPALDYPFLPLPEALVEAIQNADVATRGRITAVVASAPIIEGGRNDTLFRFGCKLRRDGFDEALLLETLRTVNQQKCIPPLAEGEVSQIYESVLRYRPSRKGYLEYLVQREAETRERDEEAGSRLARAPLPAHLMPIEAEYHLVGMLLAEADYEPPLRADDLLGLATSLLEAEHLYDFAARGTLKMLCEMSRNNEFLETTTVAAALTEMDPSYTPEGGSYHALLDNWKNRASLDLDPDLVRSLARTIKRAWRGRNAWRLAEEQKAAIAAGEDPEQVAARMQAALDALRAESGNPDADLIGNYVDDYLAQIDQWQQRGSGVLAGKSFGIRALDIMLDGMQDEELILCGGRSSMGKTAFAITTALRLSQQCAPGHYVGIVSLEMGTRAIIHRMVSMLSEYSMPDIRKAWSHVDFGKVRAKAEMVRRLPILIIDGREAFSRTNGSGGSMSADAIWSRVKAWRRLGRIDFVVIDYLEMIDANAGDAREKRETQLGNTTKTLKRMAQEQRMPVMLLVQLNREGEKTVSKQPTGTNIRGSDQPFHVADIVLMVYRAEYYLDRGQTVGTSTDPTPPAGYTIISIEKNRNGPAGTAECFFRKETACFYDWDSLSKQPILYDHRPAEWYGAALDLAIETRMMAHVLDLDDDVAPAPPPHPLHPLQQPDPQVQGALFMQQAPEEERGETRDDED